MKILYCTKCTDIVRLGKSKRKCACGEVSGKIKGKEAIYKGSAITFIIKKEHILRAWKHLDKLKYGHLFDARAIKDGFRQI